MLHDLALYALGVLGLCCGRLLIRTGVTALFSRLAPGPARRAWVVEVGGWRVEVTVSRRKESP